MTSVTIALLTSVVVLGSMVAFIGFLLAGTLRALGVLTWRVEQLETVTPSRIGRDGLAVGKKAPDFTLPEEAHRARSLSDFAGRSVLLVFTQSGCGPCRAIVPELNRIQSAGQHQVLVVNNAPPEATRQWAADVKARFPVLSQEQWSLSKRYQVFVTPFAFLIDARGIITSKGIVGSRQYLNYVINGAGQHGVQDQTDSERDPAGGRAAVASLS